MQKDRPEGRSFSVLKPENPYKPSKKQKSQGKLYTVPSTAGFRGFEDE